MSIEVGSKLQGKITGITHFGAFIELPGGATGLVHISEVADNYVKDINEHLKVGEEVLVKVLNVESDGKIGLSIRKAKDQPQAQTQSHSQSHSRPQRQNRSNDHRSKESFDSMMNKFLKDSEDRLTSLKRHTESKRGGRGARRG